MARKWPTLRVVGLDVWGPSLALARQNVAAAGLQDRVELREQSADELPDDRAFDLSSSRTAKRSWTSTAHFATASSSRNATGT